MEEAFFLLLGLAALIGLLLGPIAFFKGRGLKERLDLADRRLKDAELRLSLHEARLRELGERPAGATPDEAARSNAPEETSEAPTASEAQAPPSMEAAKAAVAPASTELPAPATPAPAVARDEPRRTEPEASFEETLGTRWAVIVGGLALAVGLVLLVRYSIEQGLLGPGPRTLIGLMVSAALAGAGEWLRRREQPLAMLDGVTGQVPIPAVLTAAGTVGAFGSIYAAHALYDLIPAAVAFVALGVVAVAAMVAAVLHGPALAALGLVGSFATPVLVSSGSPEAWPVAVYIAAVAGAAYWLARTRKWLWLALSAAGGSAIWGLLLSTLIGHRTRGGEFLVAALTHGLLHLALAIYVFVLPYRAHQGVRPSKSAMLPAAGMALVILVMLSEGVRNGQFGVMWLLGAVAAASMLALAGTMVSAAAGLAAAAGVFVVLLTRIWPHRPDLKWTGDAVESVFLNWLEPMSPMGLLGFAGALALGVFALSADRLRKPPTLAVWSALTHAGTAAATPVLALGFIWLRHPITEPHYEYAAAAGALALLYASAAGVFRAMDGVDWRSPGKLGAGFFATGALASLALGLTIVLSGGHLTVALALSALAAAWMAEREGIPALRWAVAGLGAIIAARLAWDPRIVGPALGTTPVFNWLLIGYGVPALAFAAAARLLRREPEDLPVQMAQGLAIVFSALLCFYEIRHGLNGGNPFVRTSTLSEDGLHACMAFGFAIATTLMSTSRRSIVFSAASLIFGISAIFISLVLLLFADNPFLTRARIEGGWYLNSLLIAYLLPALLAAILARVSIGRRPEWYRIMAAVSAIVLGFAYINLQTRRVFKGDAMEIWRSFGDVEVYAYSAVWLVLGLLLLAYGIFMKSREARIGSALLVVAATVKIFLFDVAGLGGGLRALSFIGLGLVLMGIGLVYQKLLFPHKPKAPPADEAKVASPSGDGS